MPARILPAASPFSSPPSSRPPRSSHSLPVRTENPCISIVVRLKFISTYREGSPRCTIMASGSPSADRQASWTRKTRLNFSLRADVSGDGQASGEDSSVASCSSRLKKSGPFSPSAEADSRSSRRPSASPVRSCSPVSSHPLSFMAAVSGGSSSTSIWSSGSVSGRSRRVMRVFPTSPRSAPRYFSRPVSCSAHSISSAIW